MTTKEYNDLCKKYTLIPYYEVNASADGDNYTQDYTLVDKKGYKQCICGYRDKTCSFVSARNKMCTYKNGQANAWYSSVKEAENGLLKRIADFRQEIKQARLKQIEEL